ncbi:retinol-binding protein pinta-like [Temnothorax nylanderi]|uniref:retinol-binding protein pinta-like n=1 Tax=Temnothorax nylanderi TaxID=102681 RepID=UPI003A83541B
MANDNVECYAWKKLSNDDKLYAATYLNETDETTRENAIAKIRRWIEENDDLREQIDDFQILRFLRVCKFNFEKTKIRMQKYYRLRSDLPEWYMNTNPFRPELQQLLDLGLYLPLRKPDDQGRFIIIVRCTRHDPRIHKMTDVAKISAMVSDTAVKHYPAASIYGYRVFIDMSNTTLRHIAQYRPYVLKNSVHAWQNYPMRVQSINILNASILLDITVRIFKSFMTEKMRNRLHVYSDSTMKNCFDDVPTNILPVEYGGTDGTIQELTEYWKKLIENNHDLLMNEQDNKIMKQ